MPLDRVAVFRAAAAAMLTVLLASSVIAAVAADSESRTKADIRAQHGPPDAFVILYFDEVAADGSIQASSLEQWTYYRDGVEFSFADDQLIAEDPVNLQPGSEAEPVPYDPEHFSAYMSLEEVVAAAAVQEYLGGPVDLMVEDGEMYVADRLMWGLKDDELRYVEAVALEVEEAGA